MSLSRHQHAAPDPVLPRYDLIVLAYEPDHSYWRFEILVGVPAHDPEPPSTPTDAQVAIPVLIEPPETWPPYEPGSCPNCEHVEYRTLKNDISTVYPCEEHR